MKIKTAGERIMSVKLPPELLKDLDDAVNVDGIFLSISDVLRYGARLALLMTRGPEIMDEMRKESKENL